MEMIKEQKAYTNMYDWLYSRKENLSTKHLMELKKLSARGILL